MRGNENDYKGDNRVNGETPCLVGQSSYYETSICGHPIEIL